MDAELVAYLDERFGEMRRYVQEVAADTRRHVDEAAANTERHVDGVAAETRRHFDVVAEGLRDDICALAEGHLDLARSLQEMRREDESAQREVLAAIKLSYAELDRRITRPESVTADLEGRLTRLEARP
jgi:hypothetical protein